MTETQQVDIDYDDLMASLFVLITHYSVVECGDTLLKIVKRIVQLSKHPDIDVFPNQRMAIAKMHNIWKAKLFNHETQSMNLSYDMQTRLH